MEWAIPLALVAAAAWAVKWHFKDVETPRQARARIISPKAPRREGQNRRAA